MVIEDEAIIALDLSYKLIDKGFTVYQTDDYYKALEYIPDKKPDIIIIDLKLKHGYNGMDIYNKYKDDDYKFIFISGQDHTKELDELIETGKVQFIDKPFTFEDLFKKINSILDS
ncbi:response regulator [Methanosphaera sp. Vir-13MRS]|uniref:response regulator n=1 Tax=Candidatus Methanosphaera massiliense TaxID=3017187 RepID=UPI0023800545|nr:response regulator [Candidatus Methanosphaera massiliense]MDD6285521.1 response regulator [Methanobacteriaceae archaeon]MDE4078595.1 response regulator [Candidatus Methanosphaera massiliense]MDY2744840.1 response regulator [Methanosphaera sp.]